MKTLREEILNNKNDLIVNTFGYLLFEESIFSVNKLDELLLNSKKYLASNNDEEIREFLSWIYNSVNQCFYSHHNNDDLYEISNYDPDFEKKWNNIWKEEILNLINGNIE